MLSLRRNVLMKLLLVSVLAVLVVQLFKISSGSEIVRELQQSGRIVAALGENEESQEASRKEAKDEAVDINEQITTLAVLPIVPTTETPSVDERVKSVSTFF